MLKQIIPAVFLLLVLIAFLLTGTAQAEEKVAKYPSGGAILVDPTKDPGLIRADIRPVSKNYRGGDAPLSFSIDLSSKMPPVGNQGVQPSCTAWACGYYYKTFQEGLEYGWDLTNSSYQMSPAFLFNLATGYDGMGTSLPQTLYILAFVGIAPLSTCPYDQHDHVTWPDETSFDCAGFFRTESNVYYVDIATPSGESHIKTRLADNKLALLNVAIYDNALYNIDYFDYNYCINSTPRGNFMGYHNVCIVGYDDNRSTLDGNGAFKMVNSWGTGWGNEGYFWVSYQALSDPDIVSPWTFFTDDRAVNPPNTHYTPDLKIAFRAVHALRNTCVIEVGLGNDSSPDWSKQVYPFDLGGGNRPFPSHDIIVDITEARDNISATGNNNFYLKMTDNSSDSTSGLLSEFRLIDYQNEGKVSTSGETPTSVPEFGANTANLTAYIGTPAEASYQSPGNGASTLPLNTQISWETADGANSYDVYFGTTTPPPLLCSNYTSTSWDPGTLNCSTTYYWRIASVNGYGYVEGQVFSFNTVQAVQIESTSLPSTLVNYPYYESLQSSGGIGPYTWSNTGALPEGLELSSEGLITGIVGSGASGAYSFTARCEDSYGEYSTTMLEILVDSDLDNDSMPDSWETAFGVDDPTEDLDNDGLTNLQEYINATNPNSNNNALTDSDGDGMPDVYEESKNVNDPAADPDGDGVSNAVEYRNGTDPNVTNTDYLDNNGDGIPDIWMVAKGFDPFSLADLSNDPDSDMMTNGEEYWNGTNPFEDNFTMQDSDGDKMPDSYELGFGLDKDTDDAGGDDDLDCVSNLREYYNGMPPNVDDAAMTDLDGDGMPDRWEYANALQVGVSDDLDDPDNDGIVNLTEYQSGWQPYDLDPPLSLTGLQGANGSVVVIQWNPSTAYDFKEYRIYRSLTAFNNTSGISTIASIDNQAVASFEDNSVTVGGSYFYAVTAVDRSLNENSSVLSMGPIGPDDGVPSAVTNLGVGKGNASGSIELTWDAYSGVDFDYYNIYRSESYIADVSGMPPLATVDEQGNASYSDLVTEDNNYYYAVTVVDVLGYENPTVFCAGPIDNIAPQNVTGFSAVPQTRQVNLSWNASSSYDCQGYRIYINNGSNYDNGTNVGNVTEYAILGLDPDILYTFKITSYDDANNESGGVTVSAQLLKPQGSSGGCSINRYQGNYCTGELAGCLLPIVLFVITLFVLRKSII